MAAKTGESGPNAEQFEQQQITALIRGFSWMIKWSPTALTQAVLFTAFPEARADVLIPTGIGTTVIMVLIGRVMDRMYWRRLPRHMVAKNAGFPSRAVRRFSFICTLLIVATFTAVLMQTCRRPFRLCSWLQLSW